ncbi:unnamed protein product [Heterobilharzia americana]|nr:unnamed protein product [Heterobilharzia americana]
MQPSVSYDAIFIKWSDDTTYNLLNLSYQMRKWFTLDRDKLDYSFKVNKARILSESKMSYALLSGFHVEWKRTTVSYFNSYIQGKYTQNPYLFSIIIKQR